MASRHAKFGRQADHDGAFGLGRRAKHGQQSPQQCTQPQLSPQASREITHLGSLTCLTGVWPLS